jgi:Ca2+-binding EF-hand superfamily protein
MKRIFLVVIFGLIAASAVPAAAAAQQQPAAPAAAAARARLFQRADIDKDGVISAEELQRLMRQRPAMQRRERLFQQRLRRLDTNRDRVVSREEWGARGPAFDRLDANKNGVLEPVELRRGMARARIRAARRIAG